MGRAARARPEPRVRAAPLRRLASRRQRRRLRPARGEDRVPLDPAPPRRRERGPRRNRARLRPGRRRGGRRARGRDRVRGGGGVGGGVRGVPDRHRSHGPRPSRRRPRGADPDPPHQGNGEAAESVGRFRADDVRRHEAREHGARGDPEVPRHRRKRRDVQAPLRQPLRHGPVGLHRDPRADEPLSRRQDRRDRGIRLVREGPRPPRRGAPVPRRRLRSGSRARARGGVRRFPRDAVSATRRRGETFSSPRRGRTLCSEASTSSA